MILLNFKLFEYWAQVDQFNSSLIVTNDTDEMIVIIFVLNELIFIFNISLDDQFEPNSLDFFQLAQRLNIGQLHETFIS